MSLSWGPSDRSTNASKAGHDSSRMLRSRFLLLVFSQVRKFLWAASALAAATVGPGSPTGRSASGMPSAVFAMTIASRSSVLASPAKSLGGPVCRESRQVRRRHPGRLGAGEREGAYVARLVDDHERVGEAAEQRVQIALPVRDGALSSISPSRVATHAQWDNFPTSSPMTASGILGGATVLSSNR